MSSRKAIAVLLGVLVVSAVAGVLWWRSRPEEAQGPPPARALGAALHERAGAPPDRSELSASGSAELRGQILDGDGVPVGGALLSLFSLERPVAGEGEACVCADACGEKLLEGDCLAGTELLLSRIVAAPGPIARTSSGDDGRYVLRGVEAGARYRLWVESERGVAVAELTGGATDAETVLAAGVPLRGKVIGSDGEPIAQAAVAALDVARGRVYDGVTDARGAFSLGPVVDGRHAIVAAQGTLIPARVITQARRAPPELVLHTPQTRVVRVLRGDQPVKGAEVTVTRFHRTEKRFTAENGEAGFEQLRPGAYPVIAREGGLTAAGTLLVQSHAGEPLLLRLAPSASLAVSVRDPSGAPVRNATVVVRVDTQDTEARFEEVLGDGGRHLFEPLPAGEAKVNVTARGYFNRPEDRVLLVPGAKASTELVLTPAETVTGTVVDSAGRPIREPLTVSGYGGGLGDGAKVGEDGQFTLFLGKGPGELEIDHPAYQPLQQRITAPATGVRLVLERGLELRGRVLDVDGEPAAGARIAVFRNPAERGPDDRVTLTDAHGEFTLGGLQPGPMIVFAAAETRHGEAHSYRVAGERVTLPVPAALLLRLKGGERMEGRIVDQHGAPAPAVDVRAELEGVRDADAQQVLAALEAGTPFGMATTGPDGRFVIETLRPGSYELHLSGDRYLASTLKASVGEPVRLVIQRRPLVRGRVLDAAGAPLRQFSINRQPYVTEDGRFEHPLPGKNVPGLRFEAQSHAPLLKPITAAEGRDLELGELRLTRGRTISGVVVDAQGGAPLAGALVHVGPEDAAVRLRRGLGEEGVRTDATGRFELHHVPEDRAFALFAAHPDYLGARAPLTQDARIALQRGGVIEGTVVQVPRGSFRRVFVTGPRNADAAPDGEGRFRIGGLPPGSYTLRVTGPLGHAFDPAPVELGAGQTQAVELRPRVPLHSLTLELAGAPGKFVAIPDAKLPGDAQSAWALRRHARAAAALQGGVTLEAVEAGRRRVVLYRETEEGLYVASLEVEVTGDTQLRVPYPPERRFALPEAHAEERP